MVASKKSEHHKKRRPKRMNQSRLNLYSTRTHTRTRVGTAAAAFGSFVDSLTKARLSIHMHPLRHAYRRWGIRSIRSLFDLD